MFPHKNKNTMKKNTQKKWGKESLWVSHIFYVGRKRSIAVLTHPLSCRREFPRTYSIQDMNIRKESIDMGRDGLLWKKTSDRSFDTSSFLQERVSWAEHLEGGGPSNPTIFIGMDSSSWQEYED